MSHKPHPAPAIPRGRGTAINPPNRFERLAYVPDPGEAPDGRATDLYLDHSRAVISDSDSPDIGFKRSVNPYRGCAHGCSYCYARPFHEYLGLSAGLDFETKLFAKPNVAALLRQELAKPGYEPLPIALSGVTDPYQPVERTLRLARACLEVLAEHRHPTCIITKSALVERDADLLANLAEHRAALVTITLTTLDAEVQRRLEPRAATPRARIAAMRALAQAGIPVAVNVSPVIPGLTEHEIPAILTAARDAGAVWATWILVRLPHSVKDIFTAWLEHHYPGRKDRVLGALREMHGGELYDPRFGHRLRGEGPRAEQIARIFELYRNRLGYRRELAELNSAAFVRPGGSQTDLFG